ncbi:hypothetical protein ACQU0X_08570 [Pseudovibrio ascidiaceicola]|uniref:hypothetical protein n=1 Tax=Pseudovibrio ascidiaceicola TaxID=285279 RepID=UPI003D3656F6
MTGPKTEKLTQDYSEGVRHLRRLMTLMKGYDSDMTATRLHIFALVAGKENVLVRDVIRQTGLKQSTVARNLSMLADKPMRGDKVGLGWLTVSPDIDDPRRVVVNTTPKGMAVIAALNDLE